MMGMMQLIDIDIVVAVVAVAVAVAVAVVARLFLIAKMSLY